MREVEFAPEWDQINVESLIQGIPESGITPMPKSSSRFFTRTPEAASTATSFASPTRRLKVQLPGVVLGRSACKAKAMSPTKGSVTVIVRGSSEQFAPDKLRLQRGFVVQLNTNVAGACSKTCVAGPDVVNFEDELRANVCDSSVRYNTRHVHHRKP